MGHVSFDHAVLRAAYALFPTGVTAVAALREGQPVGLAASSFTSVSLHPPLVSVCIARTSSTWPRLRSAPTLGVSVLAEGQAAIARQLAASGRDRFEGVAWTGTDDGAVLLDGACLWLECTLDSEVAAGDHEIGLLRVEAITPFQGRQPVVFHGSEFRQLLSP